MVLMVGTTELAKACYAAWRAYEQRHGYEMARQRSYLTLHEATRTSEWEHMSTTEQQQWRQVAMAAGQTLTEAFGARDSKGWPIEHDEGAGLVEQAAKPTSGAVVDIEQPVTHCRSCGAPIRWGTTVPGNKRCPFNVIDDEQTAVSHFTTCPDAKSWSVRSKPAKSDCDGFA